MFFRILVIFVVCLPTLSSASEECLNGVFVFDENIPKTDQFYFEETNDNLPQPGDFELINYYLMSNGCGYRSALVTVRNTSPGTTTLIGENIVALTASGHKVEANINRRISGLTTESFTISFGKVAAPILSILVSNR